MYVLAYMNVSVMIMCRRVSWIYEEKPAFGFRLLSNHQILEVNILMWAAKSDK